MKPARITSVVLALLATLLSLVLVAPTSATASAADGTAQVQESSSEDDLLRGRHHYGGGSTVGYIGIGLRDVVTHVVVTSHDGSKPSKADIRRAVEKQGVEVTSVGKVRGITKKYRAFTVKHYRHNLSMHTGYSRVEADAHHIMPRKFEDFFAGKGINIHHPANMEWWYRPSHQKYSTRYNRLWDGWIKNNRSANKKRVRAYARRMHLKYLDKYAKPGPGGCKVYTCVIDPVPEV